MNDGNGQQGGQGGAADLMTWARAHAAGLPSDRAGVRARTLENGAHEGTAKHPFPVADREQYLQMVRPTGIAALSHKATIGRIRLDGIKGIQGSVNRERLNQHLANPNLIPEGTRAPGHGMLIDLPVIVKLGNEYYVHDGHHRLTAAHLRGEQDARVRLVDLDAMAETPDGVTLGGI